MALWDVFLGPKCDGCQQRTARRRPLDNRHTNNGLYCSTCAAAHYATKWSALRATATPVQFAEAAAAATDWERPVAVSTLGQIDEQRLLFVVNELVKSPDNSLLIKSLAEHVAKLQQPQQLIAVGAASFNSNLGIQEMIQASLNRVAELQRDKRDTDALLKLEQIGRQFSYPPVQRIAVKAFEQMLDDLACEPDIARLESIWNQTKGLGHASIRQAVGTVLLGVKMKSLNAADLTSMIELLRCGCEAAVESKHMAPIHSLLESQQNPAVNDYLRQLLIDQNETLRAAAARILERRGWKPDDPEELAITLLATKFGNSTLSDDELKSLGTDPVDVLLRSVAKYTFAPPPTSFATTLGKLGDRRALKPLFNAAAKWKEIDFRQAAILAVGALGAAEVTAPLIRLLKNADPQVRGPATIALGELKAPEATGALIELLQDTASFKLWHSWDAQLVRKCAAEALGKLKAQSAVPTLVAALNDPDVGVRLVAVGALGQIGGADVVGALIAKLTDARIRSHICSVLGQLKAAEAVPELADLLSMKTSDVDAALQLKIAESLGRIGHPAAIPALIDALGSDYLGVVRTAKEALAKFDLAVVGDAAFEKLDELNCPARAAILIELMPMLSGPRVVHILTTALDDPDSKVRKAAASGLGRIPDAAIAAPAISQRALNDDDLEVRIAALTALGQIGGVIAGEALCKALEDANTNLRATAAIALGSVACDAAVASLLNMLEDPNRQLRWCAVVGLGGQRTSEAVEKLFQQLDGEDFLLHAEVLGSLIRMGASAVERLIPTLNDLSGWARYRAAVEVNKIPSCDKRLKQALDVIDAPSVLETSNSATVSNPDELTIVTTQYQGITFRDYRSVTERQIQQAAYEPLKGEDERIVDELFALRPLILGLTPGEKWDWALERIREMGDYLCARGGHWRMVLISYRYKARGGSSREMEYLWRGICGWSD